MQSPRAEDVQAFINLMRKDKGELVTASDSAVLRGVDDEPDPVALQTVATALAGEVGAEVRLDALTGLFAVDTPERDIGSGADETVENELKDHVTAVLTALGAPLDQAELSVGTLRAAGGGPDEEVTVHDVAKKVYVERRVLGLGVSGEHLVATFTLTGELIRIGARWRRFDYDASQLSSDVGTDEELYAMAAEAMVAYGVSLPPTVHAIDVGTFYFPVAPEPGATAWTLRLCGYASLRDTRGGLIPTYEFFLDGSGVIASEDPEASDSVGPVDGG